jgi:hypothetical protein
MPLLHTIAADHIGPFIESGRLNGTPRDHEGHDEDRIHRALCHGAGTGLTWTN